MACQACSDGVSVGGENQVRTRPSPVSMDNSTKLDATWSLGPNDTEKPPIDWLPIASSPEISASRPGFAPARLSPSANSLADT